MPFDVGIVQGFPGPRIPSENANIGRHFRVGKEGKYDFYVRAEFVNIFNRTYFASPITTNPQNPGGSRGWKRLDSHRWLRSDQRLCAGEHSVRICRPDGNVDRTIPVLR